MMCRLQCQMVMARLLLALAFIGCGLELCDGQAAVQWQDIPEPNHLRHRRHKHKDSKPMVKGVDYFSHHQSHVDLFDWNSFKPANPTPKEEMVKLWMPFYNFSGHPSTHPYTHCLLLSLSTASHTYSLN